MFMFYVYDDDDADDDLDDNDALKYNKLRSRSVSYSSITVSPDE